MAELTPDKILVADDMRRARTASELASWILDRSVQFSRTIELRRYARLRKGLCRAFYQEIVPFSVLLHRLYGSRLDVFGLPSVSGQAYDARILDASTTPPTEIFVQITYATNGHDESIRMEALNSTGRVALGGPVIYSGTRRTGRNIEIPLDMLSPDTLASDAARLVVDAIQRKRSKSYPRGYILIVGLDDMLVSDPERVALLERDVRAALSDFDSNFARMFVAGIKNNVFFEL
jgi:hypothetical protein